RRSGRGERAVPPPRAGEGVRGRGPGEARHMDRSLAGRTALVTGGTSDIGAAIVRALLRRGAGVAVHCYRHLERAEVLCQGAAELGRRARVVQGDLAVEAEVKRVAAEAGGFAPIDVLVNNAGSAIQRIHWLELDAPFLDRVFGLNYRAPLYLCQRL